VSCSSAAVGDGLDDGDGDNDNDDEGGGRKVFLLCTWARDKREDICVCGAVRCEYKSGRK